MNTNRTIRLLQLLDDLSWREWLPIDRLCADLDIDDRTLTRDIGFLRGLGIQVQRRKGEIRMTGSSLARLRRMMLDSTIHGWREVPAR